MAHKGQKFNHYSAEYKLLVIADKRENNLTYCAAAKKYWDPEQKQLGSYINTIKRWERQYLQGGIAGLSNEHRGRPHKTKPKDDQEQLELNLKQSEQIIREIRQLELRLEYLKTENKKQVVTE